jgi:hypothetical protein
MVSRTPLKILCARLSLFSPVIIRLLFSKSFPYKPRANKGWPRGHDAR